MCESVMWWLNSKVSPCERLVGAAAGGVVVPPNAPPCSIDECVVAVVPPGPVVACGVVGDVGRVGIGGGDVHVGFGGVCGRIVRIGFTEDVDGGVDGVPVFGFVGQ